MLEKRIKRNVGGTYKETCASKSKVIIASFHLFCICVIIFHFPFPTKSTSFSILFCLFNLTAKSMKQVPSPVADRRSSSTSLPSSPGVPHRTLGIAKTKSSTTSPLPVRKTSSGCTMSVPSEEPDAATPTRKPQSSPASTLPTSSGGKGRL